jgi:hypothetical protein
MYILKGLPVLGACKTGGEDKYSFIFLKGLFLHYSPPQSLSRALDVLRATTIQSSQPE